MSLQSSLGIDISQDQVAMVYLKKKLRGVKIAAQGLYPMPRAESEADRSAVLESCVADFLKEHRIAPEGVFIGLGEETVISRQLELPLAVKENLRETLSYEMEKYVPMPPDEVCFDYQVISEDKTAKEMSLLLIVAKRGDIIGCLELADRLKLSLTGIEIRSGALVNFMAAEGGLSDEDAFLVFVENRRITVGLVSGRRLIYSAGRVNEDNHVKPGDSPAAWVHRMKRLLPAAEGPLPVRLLGDRADAALAAELAQSGEFDVQMIEPVPAGLSEWAMAPAYGLALRGLVQSPVQVNLVPPGMRKKPSRFGSYLMLVLAVFVILTGASWAASRFLYQQRVEGRLDAEIESLASEIETVDKIQAEINRIEEWIGYLNTMRRGGVPTLDILTELTERIPENTWVRDLNLNETDLRLDGYADSASELLPLLDESPYLSDVVFISTITKGKDGKERFRIGGKIDQPGQEGEAPR